MAVSQNIYKELFQNTEESIYSEGGIPTRQSSAASLSNGSVDSFFSYEELMGTSLVSFINKRLGGEFPFLDNDLLNNISEDILRLSEDEPYGLRGATLIFKTLDRKGIESKKILKLDAGTLSTFRLYFVLREERSFLGGLRKMILSAWETSDPLPRIEAEYEVSKRRLFRD